MALLLRLSTCQWFARDKEGDQAFTFQVFSILADGGLVLYTSLFRIVHGIPL